MRFTTLAKTLVTANKTFKKGTRFGIKSRDYLHVDGTVIVHTMVVVDGKFTVVEIPTTHVTAASLRNWVQRLPLLYKGFPIWDFPDVFV